MADKNPTVIFCLPGNSCTSGFRNSWTKLLRILFEKGIGVSVADDYFSNILQCRNRLVAPREPGMPKKGCKPFNGISYDYCMWIDSDTTFEPDDFFKLFEADKDIITGMVPMNMEGMGAFGNINNWSPTRIADLKATPPDPVLLEIEWCGFAFVLVKHGVFESLEYPWFRQTIYEVDNRIVVPGEDIQWCIDVREKGWKIFAHPQVRLGHEKRIEMKF